MHPGVYIHIPFCKSRCSYCDFATDIYRGSGAVDRYVAALADEIGRFGFALSGGDAPDTLYFGGGTPSLLTPRQLETVMEALQRRFSFAQGLEFTLEMNPATVDLEKLRSYRDLGVNRASFGVQTFDDEALRMLARGHDTKDVFRTYDLLVKAGFENVSLDLIAGLPGQTIRDWEQNLTEAIAFQSQHISLYLLEVHEGTPLAEQIRSKRRPVPDEDTAAEMYETMQDRLGAAGFKQYEISNFAKPGFESRHNSKYWTLEPIHAYGVSAHSFDGRLRRSNDRDTNRYVESVESGRSPVAAEEEADLASEFVFLGLRMTDGIELEAYRSRFGRDLASEHGEEILSLCQDGLLETGDGRLRLTRKGALYSNEVFEKFV